MITICEETTLNPITTIGKGAGICYGANTSDTAKNYARGIDCLKSMHGRTWELPEVTMIIDHYSAKVMRELYTHIGGSPTRLQSSTRYIEYGDFKYITPPSIANNEAAKFIYDSTMQVISKNIKALEDMGIPKEDSSMQLPLGMESKMVLKCNLRMLIEMSHQRMCSRAYWEFRKLFKEFSEQLSGYSEEWKYIVDNYFMPKCKFLGKCPEVKSCGAFKKEN